MKTIRTLAITGILFSELGIGTSSQLPVINFPLVPLVPPSPPSSLLSDAKLQFISPLSAQSDLDGEQEGRPPNRTSGGSRSPCLEQLVALVPGKGTIDAQVGNCATESQSSLALTLAETPTFWFYLPEQSTSELAAEFVLLEGDRLIYKQQIPLTGTPGVISIRPNQSLETNKRYRWVFSILVNPQRPSQNPAVEGLIQRIEPDSTLSSQLKAATTEQERIAIYIQNGIWHDALTGLGKLYSANPGDSHLLADWSSLLGSVGLGAIAQIPIVDCCTWARSSLGVR
jgi:hypothetical protein